MSTTSPLIGITAEWNPFHAGHSAMIDIIKKAYPKAPLIAIMSGAFVQRGEPALFDKWTRAGWAVRSGVDNPLRPSERRPFLLPCRLHAPCHGREHDRLRRRISHEG